MQTSGDLFNFFPVFFFRKPGDRQQICRGHLTEGKFCRRMARWNLHQKTKAEMWKNSENLPLQKLSIALGEK